MYGKAADGPLGTTGSIAVALVGIPLCVFLFLAAIKKATAETEADDKAFLKGK
jgi:hypothetical protein